MHSEICHLHGESVPQQAMVDFLGTCLERGFFAGLAGPPEHPSTKAPISTRPAFFPLDLLKRNRDSRILGFCSPQWRAAKRRKVICEFS
jgi:hypothetical protein